MIQVSNADRVVFPEVGRTKGDVVDYYRQVAPLMMPHVAGRPLSMKRYPKGLAGPGFFQKNVPAHYPQAIGRFESPRSSEASKRHRDEQARQRDVTVYPVVHEEEQLAYLANQGAIELHVPTARAEHIERPDRIVVDLDPKPGQLAVLRRAAHHVRAALAELGLDTRPLATGSKGYHLIALVVPSVSDEVLGVALQQFAALVSHEHSDELTTAFRVANRGDRVFVDWLRNRTLATVVAPYSLRARPQATVATPITWDELDTIDPDAFRIGDLERLLERPDPIQELAAAPADPEPFVAAVSERFERAGLELEPFDRFRS